MVEGLRARTPDLDPISRIPYGPAANKGCIKRPDIRQYLAHCHQLGSESALAHMGASTYHHLSTVLEVSTGTENVPVIGMENVPVLRLPRGGSGATGAGARRS